ncbi:MAG: hypothetical protein K2X03_29290 [Bryobacteraceae bacterium]|nr:hypothetical protein [Bryobacteraceae bacterium]
MRPLTVTWILLSASAAPADLKTMLLQDCCRVAADAVQRLERGEVLGKLIETGDERDLALLSAVRLSVPKGAFLNWYRRVENYKRSPLVLEAALVQQPPRPADFEKFTIDPAELRDLRACVPGKCSVKLSAAEIERGHRELDSAADLKPAAEALLRRLLLERATVYMQQGDLALSTYHDRPEPVSVRQVFRELLASSPFLRAISPALATGLQSYAGLGSAPGDEQMFYCTRERYGFGLKPLLNLTHVVIHHASPEVSVIVAKQIWASHYYDGSLAVTVLIDAHPGTYLIYLNRSRIDLLRSGGFKRALVNRFAPGAARKEVLALKRTVETSAEAR